ncbi:MAG: prepilin-type N-terminal cleavage/methylation domain-containing protein [Acidobacteria bacterium]|nr:prepilin-type N-terminal cleavage/methylation domain-containing protein [Acidobacteriota bacterium]
MRNRTFHPRSLFPAAPRSSSGGWTLIELVIVITVMSVLTLGVVPIVKTSIRRQKEQQLREVLREMRGAIDEFRQDTVGMQCAPAPTTGGANPNQTFFVDPRSRVVLADCKIFGVDNPDRYPPDLQTLVDGVNVVPRAASAAQQFGSVRTDQGQATDNPLLATKKKVYLREIPMDPITGEREWCFRSSYAPPDEGCQSQPENIFDVRSKSEAKALNEEKYSDW